MVPAGVQQGGAPDNSRDNVSSGIMILYSNCLLIVISINYNLYDSIY